MTQRKQYLTIHLITIKIQKYLIEGLIYNKKPTFAYSYLFMDRPIYDHTIHQHAVLSKHRKCRFHFVLQKRILRRIQPRPLTEKLFCLWYPDFYAHFMCDKIRVTKNECS